MVHGPPYSLSFAQENRARRFGRCSRCCALPFAVAVAAITGDSALASRSRTIYQVWPGQARGAGARDRARLPQGALAQQGLHHHWQDACREKRCDRCRCNCSNLLH